MTQDDDRNHRSAPAPDGTGSDRSSSSGDGARDPELDSFLGAFVTGAVDEEEHARIAAYLDRCPTAQTEVDHLAAALAELVDLVIVELDAPSSVWAAIDAATTSPAGQGPAPTPGGPQPTRRPGGRRTRRPGGPAIPHAPQRQVARPIHRRAATVLVAAAMIVLLAGTAIVFRRLTVDPAVGRTEVASARVDQLAAVPGARQATLTGDPGLGTVRVVVAPDGVVLTVPDHLAPPGAGRAYQLWSLDDGVPTSLGLIGDGPAEVRGGTGPPTRLAVTVEPDHGSAAPTSAPVLTGTAE